MAISLYQKPDDPSGMSGVDVTSWAAWGRLDPLQRRNVIAEATREQDARTRTGWPVYPILLLTLGFTSPAFHEHPYLMWGFVSLIALSLGIRFARHIAVKTWPEGHERYLPIQLAVCLTLNACVAGGLYSSMIVLYGFERWCFSAVLIWVTGAAAAVTVMYAPTLSLAFMHHSVIFIPAIAVSIWVGGAESYGFAFATCLYLYFLFKQSLRQHGLFWKDLITHELEVLRTRELQLANDATEHARREAEAANRSKSEFLANMSHEIRTPIHGVMGLAQLALASVTLEGSRSHVEELYGASEGLLQLINDILDFSKIEAGKLALEHLPFSLSVLMKDVRMLIAPQANAKGIKLECRASAGLPPVLVGDPVRLRQVLFNLLGNAAKFTSVGTVSLHVDFAEENIGERPLTLHFRIQDTGIGIPLDQQARIFEPFRQADGTVTRRFGGTGLGLTICTQLVKLMGGLIWVESTPGKGSTFHFTCALGIGDVADVAQPREAVIESVPPMRILLAEDNKVNQRVATAMLMKHNHKITVAATGIEAIQAWEAGQFDLVLMDNQMPEMSGVEAAQIIRQREATGGHGRVPIVALTASAMVGDRERFLSAGMDEYLTKPFRASELYALLGQIAHARATVPAREHKGGIPAAAVQG